MDYWAEPDWNAHPARQVPEETAANFSDIVIGIGGTWLACPKLCIGRRIFPPEAKSQTSKDLRKLGQNSFGAHDATLTQHRAS